MLQSLAYCFTGVLLGTLIGLLPVVGPLVTISMLPPVTFGLPARLPGVIAGLTPAQPRSSSTTTAQRCREDPDGGEVDLDQ